MIRVGQLILCGYLAAGSLFFLLIALIWLIGDE